MSDEPMTCQATEPGRTCPCSLVTATGGDCGVFGPLPTFAEAFPYLSGISNAAEGAGDE